jgi:hypothetical protein
MGICAITGLLKSLDGTTLTNTQLLFERKGVVKDGQHTVIPRRVMVTSDMYGNVSFSLYSGVYIGQAVGIKGMEKFLVSVPDLTAEARLEDLLVEEIENVSNDLLTRIVNIRNELINIYQQTEVLGGATGVLGVNQVWQNMTSKRGTGGTNIYQNTTGGPIAVYIFPGGSEAGPMGLFAVSSDGVAWQTVGRSILGRYEVNSIIPPGHFYRLNGGYIGTWMELRPMREGGIVA